MNDIIPFEYEGRPVRVVERDGEAWFVAADVCAVLGLEQVTRAIDSLDDDERALTEIKGADGRLRQTNLISEPGMWRLVMRSHKPQAKPFQRFVTHDVLPSIRDHHDRQVRFDAVESLMARLSEQFEDTLWAALQIPEFYDTKNCQCSTDLKSFLDHKFVLYPNTEVSIRELLKNNDRESHQELFRRGIRVMDGTLWIARKHETIDAIFNSYEWHKSLLRIPGSKKSPGPMRFGAAIRRAVGIPIVFVRKMIDEIAA